MTFPKNLKTNSENHIRNKNIVLNFKIDQNRQF
jgi:hypothetical protein